MSCVFCRTVTFIADQRYSLPPPPYSSISMRLSANWSRAPPQPGGRRRKKAVIIGISYKYGLKGCLNDAIDMRHLLINNFDFSSDSILMLTELETDPYSIPTKQNIRMALKWLVRDCEPGDSLVLYYSGHGSWKKDIDGDEVDRFDETISPLDYKTQGKITGDEINATIVRALTPGVRLHAIIDACHSGTMLDLPFVYKNDRWENHQRRSRAGVGKGTNGGEAILFSGCDGHQTSAETLVPSKVKASGVMTYSFIQAIKRREGETYGSIMNSMLGNIRNRGLRQEPQLSASMCTQGLSLSKIY